jgi:TPR repeat protein
MYASGNGIPRDYVMACAWFSLAASQEGEESKTTDSLFFLFIFGRYRFHL